ncbi:MAG: type II toxin-antitoxin system HicA family toxin [Alkalilacustris sp.]
MKSLKKKRNTRVLRDVFDNPTRADVRWHDIETLLRSLGAEITEGSGSRVRVKLSGVRAGFHRPHPQPETDKGALASVRRFLKEAGIEPP